MKGLVLSGGYGTRLRPITFSQQKQLIPIANKPILFYCIEDLINSGIKTIGIVVGPNKERVIDTVRSVDWGIDIEFIHQDHPGGLAHAVKVSKDFLGDDKFVMYLGDNLLKGGARDFINDFAQSSAAASLLITKVNNPQDYGQALIDEREKIIVKLIEKPKETLSNFTLVGIYGLTPVIFKAIDNIRPSWRNQLEITDALQWLIDNGYKIEHRTVEGWWKDTGTYQDLLEANQLVLDDLRSGVVGEVEDGASIWGSVFVDEGAHIKQGATIRGPAIIGKNSLVESGVVIGPYVSVGDHVTIKRGKIENSLIMKHSFIEVGGKIVDSIIGPYSEITSNDSELDGKTFILGERSRVQL